MSKSKEERYLVDFMIWLRLEIDAGPYDPIVYSADRLAADYVRYQNNLERGLNAKS